MRQHIQQSLTHFALKAINHGNNKNQNGDAYHEPCQSKSSYEGRTCRAVAAASCGAKTAEGVTNRHVEQKFNRHCAPFRLADDYELFTDLLRQIRRGAIC